MKIWVRKMERSLGDASVHMNEKLLGVQKHFLCTMDGPHSSYSCFVIHICWKVDSEDTIEPPIQTENLRSGGAITFTLTPGGASPTSSFVRRSAMPAKKYNETVKYFCFNQNTSLPSQKIRTSLDRSAFGQVFKIMREEKDIGTDLETWRCLRRAQCFGTSPDGCQRRTS